MTPTWESPFDQSPRDAALLAEVLGALQSQLGESVTETGADDDVTPDVRELISAAVAELHRVATAPRLDAGVAPVLGSGVVAELLRRRHDSRPLLLEEPEPTVDERL